MNCYFVQKFARQIQTNAAMTSIYIHSKSSSERSKIISQEVNSCSDDNKKNRA